MNTKKNKNTGAKQVSLNKDGSPRKAGSGRTKNSFSFVEVPLELLCENLKPQTLVKVSRLQLQAFGLDIKNTAHTTIIVDNTPAPKKTPNVKETDPDAPSPTLAQSVEDLAKALKPEVVAVASTETDPDAL